MIFFQNFWSPCKQQEQIILKTDRQLTKTGFFPSLPGATSSSWNRTLDFRIMWRVFYHTVQLPLAKWRYFRHFENLLVPEGGSKTRTVDHRILKQLSTTLCYCWGSNLDIFSYLLVPVWPTGNIPLTLGCWGVCSTTLCPSWWHIDNIYWHFGTPLCAISSS